MKPISRQPAKDKRVIVIGAGASGMMAAGRAAEQGARVILLEKTGEPGQKLLLSGKTRCNLTNAKDRDAFIDMYGPNGRFLFGAFSRFFRNELLDFLKKYGVETKIERGGRIFPSSDDARDVVVAFRRYLDDQGVDIRYREPVLDIGHEDGRVTGVHVRTGFIPADAVVLATGGASYPGTGSTGDGYRMAASIGHTVTRLHPALVPLVVEEIDLAKSMQGVSLRNVRMTAFRCRADRIDPALAPAFDTGRGTPRKRLSPLVIESRQGEMMFTHFGVGGPVTLLLSLSIVKALEDGPVSLSVDLKPSLDVSKLSARVQRDFDQFGKRSYQRILSGLLPRKMIEPIVALTGIPPDTPGHQINKSQRDCIVHQMKSLRFNVKQPLPLSSAIVTAGGVSLKEIDPRTMASRLIAGLFFSGEVMDIDADTGGYNLQAAFSTGYIAGEQASLFAFG
jgi:predicted flavoprotein YhiN